MRARCLPLSLALQEWISRRLGYVSISNRRGHDLYAQLFFEKILVCRRRLVTTRVQCAQRLTSADVCLFGSRLCMSRFFSQAVSKKHASCSQSRTAPPIPSIRGTDDHIAHTLRRLTLIRGLAREISAAVLVDASKCEGFFARSLEPRLKQKFSHVCGGRLGSKQALWSIDLDWPNPIVTEGISSGIEKQTRRWTAGMMELMGYFS